MNKPSLSIVFYVFSLLSHPLMAGELEEIVTIAPRSEQEILGSSELDSDELQQVHHAHIQESLRRLPGVNLHRGNGQEYLPAIRSAVLTGAGACGSVLIMEQGIPVRSSGLCNINELFDTHSEQAQSIRLIHGAAVLYGSNALNGALDIRLSAQPVPKILIELGEDSFARFKLSSSYDNASGSNKNSRGALYLSAAHDGGFRDDSGYDQYKFSWRHQVQTENWLLEPGATLTYLDQETAGFITGKDAYKNAQSIRSNENPEAFRESFSARTWLSMQRDFGAEKQLVVTPYMRLAEMDFLQHFLPGDPLEENKQSAVGVQNALTIRLSEKSSVVLGLDLEYAQGELQQSQDAPTQGSTFLQTTVPAGKHYDYAVDVIKTAIFAQTNHKFNSFWQVKIGGRLELNDYDYKNHMLVGRTRDDGSKCGFGGCRYSRPASGSDRFVNFSPSVELSRKLNDRTYWFVRLAQSFRAPQATELYRLQRDQLIADLDSQRRNSIETGLQLSTEKAMANAVVYYVNDENVIFRDSEFFNVDNGETEGYGLELSFDYQWSNTLSLAANLNWSQHEYVDDRLVSGININGNDVDTSPHFFSNAQLTWKPKSNLSIELEWQHMGDYWLEPENQHRYEGHDVWNIRASLDVSPKVRLFARVLNLSNELYAERADYTTFTDERYFPGEARKLFIGFEYQLKD